MKSFSVSDELALFGGKPVIQQPLAAYNSIGPEEVAALEAVGRTGKLSGFIGAWCDEFSGGPMVQAFEEAWRERFGVRHAVSVNSNTSGLIAALGAIGLSPGDEVIVPPMTMSATVIAPLVYGGIPVFVDMEPVTFCLDYQHVAEAITSKTRAILVVDLFGHPAELAKLRALADERGIYLIEDAAQAPLASEQGRLAGCVGHIGVFSLNCHKHIQTGEGGVCVTEDDDLALRMRAIRNHGENIVEALDLADATNMVGFNFRLTELSAAVGIEQLKKLDRLVGEREVISERLTEAAVDLPGLTPPAIREGCRNVYYVWAAKYSEAVTGLPRQIVVKALQAEGLPMGEGYCKPLYRLPTFQRRRAIGRDGWPFSLTERRYEPNMCPVAESLFKDELLTFDVCSYELSEDDLLSVINAMQKVFNHLPALARQPSDN
jgi:dTDP-4-amino-4,6-dideoxygalactose transaminase